MSSSENNKREKSQLRRVAGYMPGQNVEDMRLIKRFFAAILFLLVIIALAVISTGVGVFQLLQSQSLSETDPTTNPTTTPKVKYSPQTKPPVTVSYIGTPIFAFRSYEAIILYANGQKKIDWSSDDSKCSFLLENKIYLLGSVHSK